MEALLVAPKSKVELFAAIRRDSRVEGLSVRALAEKYKVHRRTIREAFSGRGRHRERNRRRAVAVGTFKPALDEMLRGRPGRPSQAATHGPRLFDRLVAAHDIEGVSYSTVCEYVAWRRADPAVPG